MLTDVCISDQLPEVELISLVGETLPKYKLRADTLTDFSAYNHQDWGVQQPLIYAQDLQLSTEQIEEVFKYFSKLVGLVSWLILVGWTGTVFYVTIY